MVRQSATAPRRNARNNQVRQVHKPVVESLKPDCVKDHPRCEWRCECRTGNAPAHRCCNRSIHLPSVEDPTHHELILELTDQFQNQLNDGALQNLNGTQRCIDFRNCLHSTTLTAWDKANTGQPQTDAN